MKTLTSYTVDPMNIRWAPRCTFDKRWMGKGMWIKFTTALLSHRGGEPEVRTYCYPHDLYLAWVMVNCKAIANTDSWDQRGQYSMRDPSFLQMDMLEHFRVE